MPSQKQAPPDAAHLLGPLPAVALASPPDAPLQFRHVGPRGQQRPRPHSRQRRAPGCLVLSQRWHWKDAACPCRAGEALFRGGGSWGGGAGGSAGGERPIDLESCAARSWSFFFGLEQHALLLHNLENLALLHRLKLQTVHVAAVDEVEEVRGRLDADGLELLADREPEADVAQQRLQAVRRKRRLHQHLVGCALHRGPAIHALAEPARALRPPSRGRSTSSARRTGPRASSPPPWRCGRPCPSSTALKRITTPPLVATRVLFRARHELVEADVAIGVRIDPVKFHLGVRGALEVFDHARFRHQLGN